MSWGQLGVVLGTFLVFWAFAMFFFWPERTSRAFALLISLARHVLRLRRVAKGGNETSPPVKAPRITGVDTIIGKRRPTITAMFRRDEDGR